MNLDVRIDDPGKVTAFVQSVLQADVISPGIAQILAGLDKLELGKPFLISLTEWSVEALSTITISAWWGQTANRRRDCRQGVIYFSAFQLRTIMVTFISKAEAI